MAYTPTANTLAYYPLTSTTTSNDMSGNNKNMTNNNVLFGTYNGVNCAYFSNGNSYLNLNSSLWTGNADFTVSTWINWDGTVISGMGKTIFTVGSASGTSVFAMWMQPSGTLMVGGWSNDRNTGVVLTANKWYHLAMAQSGGTIKVYLDGSVIYTGTVSFNVASNKTRIGLQVNSRDYFYGNISEVIVENKQWTDSDISTYFNANKNTYGFSPNSKIYVGSTNIGDGKICVGSRLPAAYQEVEYIGTSGTQYINSGITIGSSSNSDAIIEGTMKFLSNSSAQVTGKNGPLQLYFGTNASGYFYGGNKNGQTDPLFTNDYKKHTFKIGNNENIFYIDGVAYNVLTYSVTGSYNGYICIGCVHSPNSGVYNYYCKSEIYGFKIRQNGTLVRNFVPCYRKSDSVIGLYDLVNNQFYTNAGTGTFSKGSNVNVVNPTAVYLGSTKVRPAGWTPGSNTLFYAALNGNYNSEGTLSPTYNTSSGVTYPTIGNIQYAYINNGKMVWNIGTPPTNTITFQARVNGISAGVVAIGATDWNTGTPGTGIELYFSGTQRAVYTQNNTSWYGTTTTSSANTWYLITGIKNGTTLSLYKNGDLVGSVNCASSFNQKTNVIIANNNDHPISNTSMRVSNIIIENKVRTVQEIQDYYNQTKSKYGL